MPAQSHIPARGLLWWMALLALLPGVPGAWSGRLSPFELAGWVLTVAALAQALWRRHAALSRGPAYLLGLALFLWLGLRTASAYPAAARPALLAALLFFAGATFSQINVRYLAKVLLRVGWLVLLVGAIDALGWLPREAAERLRIGEVVFMDHRRLAATFFHPNLFAWFLVLQWLAGWWASQGLRRSSRSQALALLAFSSLSTLFLALTLGRGAIAAAIGIVLLAALWQRSHRLLRASSRTYLLLGAAGLALGVALSWQAWSGRITQLEGMADQAVADRGKPVVVAPEIPTRASGPAPLVAPRRATLAELERMGRVEIWRDALRIWREAPLFGHGLGAYSRLGTGHLHSHSLILELAVSGGAVALLLGLGAVVFALPGRKRLRYPHLVVGYLLATGLFDCFAFYTLPMLLTAFALGGVCRDRHERPAPPLALWEPSPWQRSALAWVLQHERRTLVILFIVYVLVALARSHTSLPWQKAERPPHPLDFYAYYAATQYVLETGDSPYLTWPGSLITPVTHPLGEMAKERHGQVPLRFFYPPTALLFFAPFGAVENGYAAEALWWIVEIVLLWLLVLGTRRLMLRHLGAGRGATLLACLFLLIHAQIFVSMYLGQVSMPLAVACLWTWLFHAEGRSLRAGALIATATAIKVFPVLWLGFLVLKPRRESRLLVGFAALLGFLGLLSLAAFPPAFWDDWHRWVLQALDRHPPRVANLSLKGMAYAFQIPSPENFRRLGLLVLGLAFLAGLVLQRQTRGRVEVSVLSFVALTILALPLAWQHYLCLLAPFLAALLAYGLLKGDKALAFACGGIYALTSLGVSLPSVFRAEQLASLGLLLAVLLPVLLPMLDERRAAGVSFCWPHGKGVSDTLFKSIPMGRKTFVP